MGSTDYGNQILTFDYKQTATSQGFNKLNYEILSPGIYKGGLLTKNTDTLVDVSPLICFIEDKLGNGLGVRIETTTTPNIIVDPTIPYIILRFEWANTDNVYADIIGVAQASLLSTDLILGICLFDGSVMRTVFDYTTRNFKGNLGITTGIEYNKPENLHLGDISVDIINNTTSLSIRADSYVEIDGMYINYTQDIQIIDTPTNSVNNYIYIEKDTNGILKFSTTAPAWNDSKRGWYDAGGTQRYLGMAYYDGANFSNNISYTSILSTLPIGIIWMFDGSGWVDNTTIPGWYACIAANAGVGAPDMVDKFVMGKVVAGSGATGGSNSHTITSAELPTHTHTIDHTHATSNVQSVNHTHDTIMGSHDHIIKMYSFSGTEPTVQSYSAVFSLFASTSTQSTDLGTKTSGNQSASHTHTIPAYAGSSGNGGFANNSFDNRPAYYSMIFIRKCI